jgi:MFS family permease
MVSVGLPTLQSELHAPVGWIGLLVTGYWLIQAILMPLAAKLGEKFGRRRTFLSALTLFACSSLAVGLAPNIYVLLAFRGMQAIAASVFLPVATGIVDDLFGTRRQTAIGLFTTIPAIGVIVGPNMGGVIIDTLGWRWMFFVNVPVALGLFVAGHRLLPALSRKGGKTGIDWPGAALFAMALTAIVYALTFWANHPDETRTTLPWVILFAGIAILGLFLRQESRAAFPLIEVKLLRLRSLFIANLQQFIFGMFTVGTFSFVPYYAQVAYGMSPSESALILTFRSLALVLLWVFCSVALLRFGYRRPMLAGVPLISASLFVLSLGIRDIGIPDTVWLSLILVIAGIGIGIMAPAANNAALDTVPERISSVAAIRGVFRTVGGIVGSATVVLTLSRFSDKGEALERVFLLFAVMVLLSIVLVFFLPDGVRRRDKA